MSTKQTISIEIICQHYEVESDLIQRLNELGLVEVEDVDNEPCVDAKHMNQIEKIMRLYHQLEINPEGIDVVLNLLKKIKHLEQSLVTVENQLDIFKSLIRKSN